MPSETTRSLKRAFAIIDCFSLQHSELGVREVARKLDISSSTAGRLMASLKDLGVLRQDSSTHLYSLGGKVLAWAGVYSSSLDIRASALAIIGELHKNTDETVSLYILEGNERLCVERRESHHSVRIVQRVGRRLPLYAGSAGKVFLAFLPDERRNQILDQTDWKAYTENTITERGKLLIELEKIRQQNYAVSIGEWILEASGVAAPVFNQQGEIEAALTISGPAQRFTNESISKYIKEVTHMAGRISFEMGYNQNKF
ncbi:MAG: IclR family transcriptional regulator [Anaerolineaceae bacterium]|nr:IclR family transcriptional regulator [Anaerolineaceae bacterium]